jgi:SAM-dependent methyltransferase
MTSGQTGAVVRLARRLLRGPQLNHLVRFEPVLRLVRERPTTSPTLLDVGSGTQGIASLLPPGWQVTSVDADFEDYGAATGRRVGPDQVVGDVRALPFADRAFDFVVAVDLLEHVPPDGREQAVQEICRVAGSRAVVACPAGEQALAADRRLAERILASGRTVPPWLTEHLDNGFPQAAEIAAAAAAFGTVRLLANENLAAHERLVWAELRPVTALALRLLCRPLRWMLAGDRRPAQVARAVLRAVRGSDRAPTYRAVVAIDIRPAGAAQFERHSSE